MMPDGDIVMYADSQLRFVASAVPLFQLAEAGRCTRAQPTPSMYRKTKPLTLTTFDSGFEHISR